MIARIINRIKQTISKLIFRPLIIKQLLKILKVIAITGQHSNTCIEQGFLPLKIDYYSPIPDIQDLQNRNIWSTRSTLPGINFRDNQQLEILRTVGSQFAAECNWPLEPSDNPAEFYLQNQSFSYGCAASTHCLIRHYQPKRIIEIGSGMSSMIIAKAIGLNTTKNAAAYTIVDPFPGKIVSNIISTTANLIQSRVELLKPDFFDQLEANDILFIDSGHCVRIGGDVNFLFLELLPRLKPDVIVHIHDIALPYEYPKAYATSETFRQFWTEQYLLQAFLCHNNSYEILLAMHYIMSDHIDIFKKTFPHYNPTIHTFTSGSFWIRRIG